MSYHRRKRYTSDDFIKRIYKFLNHIKNKINGKDSLLSSFRGIDLSIECPYKEICSSKDIVSNCFLCKNRHGDMEPESHFNPISINDTETVENYKKAMRHIYGRFYNSKDSVIRTCSRCNTILEKCSGVELLYYTKNKKIAVSSYICPKCGNCYTLNTDDTFTFEENKKNKY